MGKKLFSLCMALALCLGLLPVTALAVGGAPSQLYVGDQQVSSGNDITYWTTDKSTGGLTKYAGNDDKWNVKYDPSSNTLTLRGATIQGGSTTESAPFGSGIYALCSSNQPVALTIELIGENTITGNCGIYVDAQQGETVGTNASLLIRNSSDNGILEVSGFSYGIYVKSGTGDASLNINDASVVAKTTQTYSGYAGVYVQSSAYATSSPQLSLAVNGGSLTTSASEGNDGIQFYVVNPSVSATTSLTVSNNAIVDARNGGIKALKISETLPTPTPTGDNRSGIVFDGKNGTVYGDVTLQEDLEIGEGESLKLDSGASLNAGGHNVIVDGGTLGEGFNLGDSVKYAPTITTESLSNGNVGTFYNQTLAADGDATITWSSSDLPEWLTLDSATGVISGTPTTAGTSTFTVKATNAYGSDSKQLNITIDTQTNVPVTGVTLNKTELTLTEGNSETLTATVKPSNATNQNVTWSSNNLEVATVENGTVTAKAAGTATITVTTEDGSFTAICTITVEKPYTPPPYIPPTYAVTVPETTGGTVEVSPSRASSGRRVTITATPDTGYELESLTVLDSRGSEIALTAQGDGKYTFTMPSRKVTVQASFAPVPLPFEDVPPGAWYESAVRHAYFHNIMEGMSATTFQPNGTLSRAMAVQIFYNLEGHPDISDENLGYPYEDVDAQAWYGDAVYWARITGVATGYGDGTFQPTDSITRQEFAQMLYNYAKYKGYDLTAEGDLSQFPDSSSVADWAKTAMSWANGNKLINGHDDGTIDAAGIGTRAQAASILMRFDQNLAEK